MRDGRRGEKQRERWETDRGTSPCLSSWETGGRSLGWVGDSGESWARVGDREQGWGGIGDGESWGEVADGIRVG